MNDSTASHWRVVTESQTTLIDTLKNFILQFKKPNTLILITNQKNVYFSWGVEIFK